MDEVDVAVRDLIAVRRSAQQDRIAVAMKRRKELMELLKAGLVPPQGHNPRYEWLSGMVNLLLDVLANSAKDFNEANPDECILVHDFYDALQSAAQTLLSGARKLDIGPA